SYVSIVTPVGKSNSKSSVFQELRQPILGLEFEDADPVLRRASLLNSRVPILIPGQKRASRLRRSLLTGTGASDSERCGYGLHDVAAAPTLPAGYIISASRIADRRMILAGYRLADLLTRVVTK